MHRCFDMDKTLHWMIQGIKLILVSSTLWTLTYSAELKLSGGLSVNQGRVEIKLNGQSWQTLEYGTLASIEAGVVCRELGYRYGMIQPEVYSTRVPDFETTVFRCNGTETKLGQCAQSDGSHVAIKNVYYYAGVCCSNSPQFQERIGDDYLGHCVVTWGQALSRCEDNDMALSLSPRKFGHFGSMFWKGEYFTPWLWSDGCFGSNETFGSTHTLEFNSPQACLQYCGDAPHTKIALSGLQCICLNQTVVSLVRTVPKYCNTHCSGDTRFLCGNGTGQSWNIYTIAVQDEIFYSVTNPTSASQCAVFLAESSKYNKLASQSCETENGYICGQFRENGFMGIIKFSQVGIHSITLQEARSECRTIDSLQLVGQYVLTALEQGNQQMYNHLWVDIQRTVTPILLPKVSDRITPELCISINTSDKTRNAWVVNRCSKQLLYACSKRFKGPATPGDHLPTKWTTKPSTGNGGYTIKPMPENLQENNGLSTIVFIVAGAVCGIGLVTICTVCCIRYKKSQRLQESPSKGNKEQSYELVDQSQESNAQLYDEIREEELSPDHLYHDLEETKRLADQIKDREDTVPSKEPVREKISYAFPPDSIKHTVNHTHRESGTEEKGNKYTSPYDAIKQRTSEPQNNGGYEVPISSVDNHKAV